MATRPASKLNLQEFGIQDEIELVDKQARQSIENIIDDTATSTDSTYSSSKIETELSSIEDEVDAIIDDTTSSDDSTWSSSKITEEIEDRTSVTKTATGNPIELTDAASAPIVKCVSEIQGSQDLHGYDKPWVGGAGKNKIPVTASGTTVNGVTFTVNSDGTILANGTATGENAVFSFAPTFEIQDNTSYILSGVSGGSSSTYRMMCYWRNSSSGNVGGLILTDGEHQISVSDYNNAVKINTFIVVIMNGYTANNILFKPMVRLATESDSTFAPYSNICPITAYTEGEIDVRGRNLFSYDDVLSDFTVSGRTISNTVTDNRAYVAFTIQKYLNGSLVAMIKGVNIETDGHKSIQFNLLGSDFDSIRIKHDGGNRDLPIARIPVSESGAYTISFTVSGHNPSVVAGFKLSDIQLEIGEVAHDYADYSLTTHTTTFPSAIYRGSEDVVNGEVTKEWAFVDLASLEWRYYSDYHLFTAFVRDSKYSGASSLVGYGCVCSCYHSEPNKTWNNFSNGDINIGSDTIGGNIPCVNIREDSVNTVSDFATMMTGQTLAYELATPAISTISPTNLPIKSLSGYNHIESSTGDMEVEYITEEYQPLVDLIEDAVELPAVTSLDDGKVLTVVDGKWVAASLPVGQNIQY